MLRSRASRATDFCRQILDTVAPCLDEPSSHLDVLDVGCGYGHTSIELARHCQTVVGLEPSEPLYEFAQGLRRDSCLHNVTFVHLGVSDMDFDQAFDLIVLDNVLEHLCDQPLALERLSSALRRGGVVYLLAPNRLWPIEAHYRLPFLSYLPIWLANLYLRSTRRGVDYSDASYAPTYLSLRRMLRERTELRFQFVLPAHLELATDGAAWHYRAGAALIRKWNWLWWISKAFLVIIKKVA